MDESTNERCKVVRTIVHCYNPKQYLTGFSFLAWLDHLKSHLTGFTSDLCVVHPSTYRLRPDWWILVDPSPC